MINIWQSAKCLLAWLALEWTPASRSRSGAGLSRRPQRRCGCSRPHRVAPAALPAGRRSSVAASAALCSADRPQSTEKTSRPQL
eukprot:6177723-Pleurochrysis_carterae.AAC.3